MVFVSIPQSLLGFYLLNKIMTWLLGEFWISRVIFGSLLFFVAVSPIVAWAIWDIRREQNEEVKKELYINARNNRIRATHKREDWGKFDFDDPTW